MADYDLILRDGMIYDGTGNDPIRGDVAIQGEKIVAVGDVGKVSGKREISLDGLAVAPGFINMLSWSIESLIHDGRSMSEIKQGVTLEVMGEGTSMGPLSPKMKAHRDTILTENDIQYEIEWTTLGEYLEFLELKGVACNVTSFVGSSTLRIYAAGYDDRPVTEDELNLMKSLLDEAMREGAVGMSSALIYPPAAYQTTQELIELCKVVAQYNGMYISHIRSESSQFIEALDEHLDIMRQTGVTGEIYHLKSAGTQYWYKMDEAIAKINAAREEGLPISTDMYTYPFSGTGLASCIPPWAHDGGFEALLKRLRDEECRQRLRSEMTLPSDEWENMYYDNGLDGILLAGFKNPKLRQYIGKTLGYVVRERGTSPEDTLMDLILEDESRIFTMYFSMSEDNLRKQVVLPYMSFCSDASSIAPEGVFLNYHPHPRAYGSFARVIGKYVRDEALISLQDAVRRLAALPADNLKLRGRGYLRPDYFADVVVFDPNKVQDYATADDPHQYSEGMIHVFVNGTQVLSEGEHTGNLPGQVVRGPGWTGWD